MPDINIKATGEIVRELGNILEVRTVKGIKNYRIEWKIDNNLLNLPGTKRVLANILHALYEAMLEVAIKAEIEIETPIVGLDGQKLKVKK